MRSLILIVALLTYAPTSQATLVNTIGSGATSSCGTWLDRRQQEQWFDMGNWALGYISGAATFGAIGNPLENTDAYGVAYWLDNYWRSQPSGYFVDAVKAFIHAHQQ